MANRAEIEDALTEVLNSGGDAQALETRLVELTGQADLSGEEAAILSSFVDRIPKQKAKEPEAEKPTAKAAEPTRVSSPASSGRKPGKGN